MICLVFFSGTGLVEVMVYFICVTLVELCFRCVPFTINKSTAIRHRLGIISRGIRFDWCLIVLVVLRINVDLAIFKPYLDLEAGDNQSLKIQVARPGIEPRSSCSASQELNHSATAAPVEFGSC